MIKFFKKTEKNKNFYFTGSRILGINIHILLFCRGFLFCSPLIKKTELSVIVRHYLENLISKLSPMSK